MWSALKPRTFSTAVRQWKRPPPPLLQILNRSRFSSSVVEYHHNISSNTMSNNNNNNDSGRSRGLLNLEEVEKTLRDVKADDVKVIPVPKHYDFADYMVIATGRSDWHVRNIAQALIYKVKQKQKGAKRMVLPSVEGQEGGKWIVIDSGNNWFIAFLLGKLELFLDIFWE